MQLVRDHELVIGTVERRFGCVTRGTSSYVALPVVMINGNYTIPGIEPMFYTRDAVGLIEFVPGPDVIVLHYGTINGYCPDRRTWVLVAAI